MAQQLPVGQGLIIIEDSRPHSVGLLWTSDQPDAETTTWQHSQETDTHAPGGVRTRNPSKWVAEDREATGFGHSTLIPKQKHTYL
jgi:hypothetical protein